MEEDIDIDVFEVPPTVRDEQITRLKQTRKTRDSAAVKKTLNAISRAAKSGDNLLAACIPSARARATVGEISGAMENVFGRYVATTHCISGVYAAEYGDSEVIASIRKRTDDFLSQQGRRPRMLVTKMGQDGHDRGVKVIATGFADLGFDVDISPMFQTPEEAAKMAVENDVHIVGVSSQVAGHKILIPNLISSLKAAGGDDIIVVAGGIIPPADYDFLHKEGVACVFGPGTSITNAANQVLNALDKMN
jgi:methylmalonyl-CoA mutase